MGVLEEALLSREKHRGSALDKRLKELAVEKSYPPVVLLEKQKKEIRKETVYSEIQAQINKINKIVTQEETAEKMWEEIEKIPEAELDRLVTAEALMFILKEAISSNTK